MPVHQEHRVLPFTPHQMFDLVLDVGRYPEFLPWCVATRVKNREGEDVGHLVADMAVGFKIYKERYTSKATFEAPGHADGHPGEGHIHVTDVGGPFKHLETDWRFRPHSEGCEVDFHIDFEFSSKMLERVMGSIFNEAAQRMMQAFVERAREVYAHA